MSTTLTDEGITAWIMTDLLAVDDKPETKEMKNYQTHFHLLQAQVTVILTSLFPECTTESNH